MIGPAEIEEMMAEYAEALVAGEEDAIVKAPVWGLREAASCGLPEPVTRERAREG